MDHIIEYDPELPDSIPSPAYVVDLKRLRTNLEILSSVQKEGGFEILAALKGFAMFRVFPEMEKHLAGVCASGPWEARLGAEEFGKEVHLFAPAYSENDFDELLPIAHHISFNSFEQFERHKEKAIAHERDISLGLRVNPEYSEVEVPLYDPCAPGSRLGIRRSDFEGRDISDIEGLHFHTMCEQNSDTLERTIERFEALFGDLLPSMRWVNFGGGHHITSPNYDRERLIRIIRAFRGRHPNLKVYLEPGEAIAINTGVLVASILDIIPGDTPIAILDVSATCHMPDVLEMPYRPVVFGGGAVGEKPYPFRLGGLSCLAGDVIGEYAFDRRLAIGDRLYFMDMAHYTMVKTTTFNGIKHPSIATWDPDARKLEVVREFTYSDYKNRLS